MNKICVVGCYFGNFPNYFNLWLKTCELNKNVDFLIFTDCNVLKYDRPNNVEFITMQLSDVKEKASAVLGFDVPLNSAYKCCDCKPLFGKIFEEYLTKYDFWGHCDFDLMWGNLSEFFDKFQQESFDKFLTLGHLSLYRNTKENNERYLLDGSLLGTWKEIFSSEVNYGFDEEDGIGAIFKTNGLSMFSDRIYADISPTYKRFRCARKDKNYPYQIFFWRDGGTYRAYFENGEMKEEEYIYIHFQKRGLLKVHDGIDFTRGFFITNSGFYPMERNHITMEDIQKYNPYKSQLGEGIERIRKKVFRKSVVKSLMNRIKYLKLRRK